MFGTTPEVLTVTRRRDRPYALSSSMTYRAATTLSKLVSGSPIPIITTLVIIRFAWEGGSSPARAFAAHHSCPRISPVVRLRLNPCLPVEQNEHSSAQPTWLEMHRV